MESHLEGKMECNNKRLRFLLSILLMRKVRLRMVLKIAQEQTAG